MSSKRATTRAITIYHNPRCSKSREALKFLTDQGITPTVVEYLKNPLNKDELKELLSLLGCQPKAFVRSQDQAYKDSPFDLDDADIVTSKVAANSALMERPIVVVDSKKAVIVRPTTDGLAAIL